MRLAETSQDMLPRAGEGVPVDFWSKFGAAAHTSRVCVRVVEAWMSETAGRRCG